MKRLRITLEGKTYDVCVEVSDGAAPSPPAPAFSATPSPVPVMTPVPVVSVAAVPAPAGANDIVCPMPGTVFKVRVAVGEQIAADQELLVLEAMKMETPIRSHAAGTVVAILVKEGDAVSEGQVLVRMG